MQSVPPLSPAGEKSSFFTWKMGGYLLFFLFFLFHIPNLIPLSAPEKCSLDEAWIRVLNWEMESPFPVPERIFTYGPLGSFLVPAGMKSFLGGFLLFCGAALLLLNLWKVENRREFLFAFLFLLLSLPLSGIENFLLLFPFLLLQRVEKEEKKNWKDYAFFAGGGGMASLLVLGKFQYFPLLLFTFLLLDAVQLFRKKFPFFSLQFFFFHILFFYLCPTRGNSFPEYFRGSMEILNGFQETMVWFDASPFWLFLLLLVSCGIFTISAFFLFRDPKKEKRFHNCIFLLLLGAELFVSYKYGAVRGDAGHIGSGLVSLSLIGGFLAWKSPFLSRSFRWIFAGAGFCLIALVSYKNIPSLPENLGRKATLQNMISLPETFRKNEKISSLSYSSFPAMEGKKATCDSLVPDGNGMIFAGNFFFTPRPVFHSYSAYTPYLIEKNRSFLMGKGAPECLIFRLDKETFIAGATPFPSLGDPSSLLLSGAYIPWQYSGRNLLLKKKSSPMPVQLREVERKKVKFGEELLLPAFSGGKIYCRIFFTPSLFGKLLSLLHRPVLVRITGNMENGQGFSYDMPGRMGETYFLLSPLLETTSRMETYLKGGRLPGVEKILFTADHRFFSRGRGGNPIDLFLGRMAYCNTIEVIFYKETEYKK